MQRHRWLRGVLLALGASIGCSRAAPPSRPDPRPRNAAAEPRLPEGPWKVVAAPRRALSLRLPAAPEWHLDDSRPDFFVAQHRATGSELALATWLASRSVTVAECEREAVLRRPSAFSMRKDELLESRPLSAPADYWGELRVQVRRDGGALHGRVIAIGRTVGRCYAGAFTASAATEGALGDRLAVGAAILDQIEQRSPDARVGPASPP